MTDKYLSVHVSRLQLRDLRMIEEQYISFHWRSRFYFTTTFSNSMIQNFIIPIDCNIILPLEQLEEVPNTLNLQNWQNNMILFQHEIDISELKTRNSTKKKHEIRQRQILEFTIHVLSPMEFSLSDTLIPAISQHFLIIHGIKINDTDPSVDVGPSYFEIISQQGNIIIPVVNSVVNVMLPNWIQIHHVKNGKMRAKSRRFQWQEITTAVFKLRMVVGQDLGYDMEISLLWGINLWRNRFQNSLLLDAFQILMYDMEIKFENTKSQSAASMKFKVISNNKAYELNGEIDPSKSIKFARIIYFIIKSQQEDFSIVIEKNFKIVAKATVGAQQIISYHLNTIKKKLIDPSTNKLIATIRFKCQKAKTLSLPQNNTFWKNCNKNKLGQVIMLQFSQISVNIDRQIQCGIIVKTEAQQIYIPELCNFKYFKLESEVPEPVSLAIKQEGNIYMKMIDEGEKRSEANFIGIAVINYKQLRLGINCLSVSFFKQQEKICEGSLLINKVMPYPFIKSIFQPESIITSNYRAIRMAVNIKKIELNQYYYTYQYDGKSELYCIVEINRIKKVLILERFKSSVDKLLFINESGSDLLNFTTEQVQSAKVKFTLLISDEGLQEEIYGSLHKKIKIQQLHECSLDFKNEIVLNEYGINVGEMEFEVSKSSIGDFKKVPLKKQLNNVKYELDKVNRSIEKVERSMGNKDIMNAKKKKYSEGKRYGGNSLVLPQIKDPKQERLKNLARMLQMKRKAKMDKINSRKQNYTSITNDIQPEYEQRYNKQSRVQSQRPIEITKDWREQQSSNRLPSLQVMREEAGESQKASKVQIDIKQDELDQNEFAQFNRQIQ